jgi:quercetin dioxygenase-like cupin family protein
MHATSIHSLPEHVLGATRLRVLVSSAATNGAYEILEFRGEPGSIGPPAHVHRRADEAFIVLEGALDMRVSGTPVRAGAGTTVHVARGEPHTFEYAAPGTRFLAVLTPATRFDEYVEGLRALLAESGGGPIDAKKRLELMARHDAYPG